MAALLSRARDWWPAGVPRPDGEQLAAFLWRVSGEPFQVGTRDCGLTLADWVRECRGVDPAAPARGRYRTKLGWQRLASRAGGLTALVGGLLEAIGLEPTEAPKIGDVGVVIVPIVGEACAIRTARGWAVKLTDGLIRADFRTVRAWSV